jgi:hypothetical protein
MSNLEIITSADPIFAVIDQADEVCDPLEGLVERTTHDAGFRADLPTRDVEGRQVIFRADPTDRGARNGPTVFEVG